MVSSSIIYSSLKVIILQLFMMNSIQSLSIDDPILTIEDGMIRGKKDTTVGQHKTYYSFRGIPFAKPPLESLRFKPPVKNSKWSGILDATKDKSQCVQGYNPVVGREDCLYINVYTPTLEKKNLAVLVWIYGGGFAMGNSSYVTYGPDYLLDEDVVFVDFNYRTGSFGFLSTQDLVCPGNNGLRDQLLALKWVQNNIEKFGGDFRNVTIYGQSAGAASVAYLVQSKLSKGLFKGAIMSSGTSLCEWALNRKSKETAYRIGQALKVNTTNSKALVEGLRKINHIELQKKDYEASLQIMMEDPLEGVQFGPVIEPYHKDAVVDQENIEVMSTGKFQRVPLLIGMNSNEAAAPSRIPPFVDFILSPDITIPDFALAGLTNNGKVAYTAGEKIKDYYFGDQPPSTQKGKAVKFISDSQWNYPVRKAVIRQSQFVPIYFYGLWYESVLGGTPDRKFPGVGHSEDLGYVFRSYIKSNSSHDYLVGRRMVRMITNFVKYSNPTPKEDELLQNTIWPLSTALPNNLVFLKIGYDLEIALNPFHKNMRLFDDIFRTYGTPPYY
ncbi:unnamed protein product [Phaedon cochleariae]|uniref:Carboxylic ester hydrolase n=1 Tax=Phaedon cochleariae TaxID=80249 RepID=A0A9P0GPK0_PHACE|nr:unnamed protein product [Phaedon cochleariae]